MFTEEERPYLMISGGGGGVVVAKYNGLYRDVPPEGVSFFRLVVT